MESLLGLELDEALRRLDGEDVRVVETSSLKGVADADTTRVLRVRKSGGAYELVVARCRTIAMERAENA